MASVTLPPGKDQRWSHLPVALLLAGLVVLCLPQYLAMGLWGDVTLHDICARNMLTGGIHYRDIFETNLPGMDWLHVAIRELFGWSFAAIRAVDVLFFAATVWLLTSWLASVGASNATRLWTALALTGFYFSTSEPCHCQRDVWMLVPALMALALRRRRLQQLLGGATSTRLVLSGFVEGLCWGAAIWIKPHILVPLLACQITVVLLARRAPEYSRSRLTADGFGLLSGGLLAGGLGMLWLVRSGTWPYFVDVLVNWDRDYNQSGSTMLRKLELMLLMFLPWNLLHFFAVPLAVRSLRRAIRGPAAPEAAIGANHALYAALYLGWMAQAVFLQKEYWYIRLPLILLALPLFAEWLGRCRITLVYGSLLTLLAAALTLFHPMIQPERFTLWARCCTEGSTPQLRDELSLTRDFGCANWTALEQVRRHLEAKDLHDGELLCYNDSTHPLYLYFNLRPAGKFLHWTTLEWLFPGHLDALHAELNATHPRYVVTDLRAIDYETYQMWRERGIDPPAAVPEKLANVFPYREPIVFHSGPYLVHEVRDPRTTR